LSDIDPRALIDPATRLAAGVRVGPYSVIGADVEIGAGCEIGAHVIIEGPTRIGRDNRIHPFAVIGGTPQDMKYAGEPTLLEIGDGNLIREYVTLNRGTVQGGGVTRIGHHNWIMAQVHIAHDCIIGNHAIFANAVALAGHVTVQDHAVLGGYSLVSQFCRIGAHAFTAMGSVINQDVPPFVSVSGHMARPFGINAEGLKRRGYTADAVHAIRRAYKLLYKSELPLAEAIAQIETLVPDYAELALLVEFLKDKSRGILR
jgi:UDP-N-acetylglucosamine acyltransferase